MKAVIITLALAGLASTASLDAQVMGARLPTPSTTRGTSIDGSWSVVGRDGNGNTIYERRIRDGNGNIVVQRARRNSNGSMSVISSRVEGNVNTGVGIDGSWRVVGRDGNGNTIYERRIRDRNGNIVIQRARRDANGNMSIISTNRVASNDNRNNRNCDYNRTTNTVGDIIFGRINNTNCDDYDNRIDGGWYQVGQGRDNNSIYERRVRDRKGNLVIQRARRNSDGTFRILSTRSANDNDKQWRKAQRKEQKQQDKDWRKSQSSDDDDQRSSFVRDDDRSFASGNSAGKSNGKGKDNVKGKDHKNKH
jgi:hypothetical protein